MATYLLRHREDLRRFPYFTIPESRNIKNLHDLRYWYQFQQSKIIDSNTSIEIKDFPFNEEAHAALSRSLEEQALSYEKLYDCFVPKASPHQGFREDREKKLENASTYPHFAFALLRVIACPKGFSNEHDKLVCMAATRRLKDFLSHKLFEIPNQERDYLKTLIFCLMLSPPFPCIDSLLDHALDVLCSGGKQSRHRLFWVPISELNLEASHTYLTGSLIDDAKSIIRNFQEHRDGTNLFFNALHYCTYRMQMRVLDMFYTMQYPASNDTTIDHHSLLHIQCCRILSLSHRLLASQEYLVHRFPRLKEEFSDQGGVLSTIDKLRFSVCENIALVLMSNHQERCYIYGSWDHELELELYIISPVIFLLQNLFASTSSSCDLLIVSAANCLMKSTSNDFIKSLVFREIVIPNVCVKDEDERLFEENCHEFIQSDMYASDSHTKRGIACNFLKKLVMKAEKEFATMLSKEMREMLAYKDWKIKECAICLVVLLMAEDAEGNSILSGMEERGCYFVDPNSFFKSVIEPELRSNKVNEFPMLKAAALKFLGKLLESRDFVHSVFSESLRSDLVHSVSRFFHSKSKVVHTYALNSALVLLEKFPASQELERLEEETFKFL